MLVFFYLHGCCLTHSYSCYTIPAILAQLHRTAQLNQSGPGYSSLTAGPSWQLSQLAQQSQQPHLPSPLYSPLVLPNILQGQHFSPQIPVPGHIVMASYIYKVSETMQENKLKKYILFKLLLYQVVKNVVKTVKIQLLHSRVTTNI